MDIISHTLSGVAMGTVVAGLHYKKARKVHWQIIGAGMVGGFVPDVDAIGLTGVGTAFINLFLDAPLTPHQVYTGKYWFSHHGALHSATFGWLFILFFGCIRWFLKQRKHPGSSIGVFVQQRFPMWLAFFTGLNSHLLEDMPTPFAYWGGVNYFWPSEAYYGGYGKIWWWNNYDLVLIITGVIVVNLIVLHLRKWLKRKVSIAVVGVAMLGIAGFVYQVNNRGFDFNHHGSNPNYQEFEAKSLEIQREILGQRVYNFMYFIDQKIPFYF